MGSVTDRVHRRVCEKNMMTPKMILSALLCSVAINADADNSADWRVSSVGDEINSEYHDGWSTVSDDDLTLYFASNRPGGFVETNPLDDWGLGVNGTPTRYDMYVSQRKSVDQPWGKPSLLPAPINSIYNDHSAAQSADGHYLFFASDRPGGCGDLDLYVSYREDVSDDRAWQSPQNLGCQESGGPNGAAIDSCPIIHQDGDETKIYFTASTTPNPATLDYKYTRFNAKTMTATGEHTINISTEHLDGHIDPKFGFVWAALPKGQGGSDVWKSSRLENDRWSTPVNLGTSINTEHEEQLPAPVDDGNKFYFPSNRPGGKGGMDIYQATRTAGGG